MCLSLLVSRSRCILTPLLSCRLVQYVATVDFSPRGSGRKRELGGKERGATEKWECRHFFFKCFYGGRRCLDLFLFCFDPSSLLPLPPISVAPRRERLLQIVNSKPGGSVRRRRPGSRARTLSHSDSGVTLRKHHTHVRAKEEEALSSSSSSSQSNPSVVSVIPGLERTALP